MIGDTLLLEAPVLPSVRGGGLRQYMCVKMVKIAWHDTRTCTLYKYIVRHIVRHEKS